MPDLDVLARLHEALRRWETNGPDESQAVVLKLEVQRALLHLLDAPRLEVDVLLRPDGTPFSFYERGSGLHPMWRPATAIILLDEEPTDD